MYSILLTSLLSLPMYPLNPTSQDTIPTHNMHLAVGWVGDNDIINGGPQFLFMHEYRIEHPFVLRGSIEYRPGKVDSKVYPDGDIHSLTFGFSAFYYRGTDALTGYLGAGVVYTTNWFSMDEPVADSLKSNEGVTAVDVTDAPGYRFTFGLRFDKRLSLEITLTNTRPDFVRTRQLSEFSFARTPRDVKLNNYRLSLGYMIPLGGG